MITHLTSEPSYSATSLGRPPSPSAWITGWQSGWNQPANTAARLGQDFGHNVLPALIICAVISLFVARIARERRRRRRGPA